MSDEINDRIWVRHGGDFIRFVNDAIDAARAALQRLHEIEFDAPWRR